MISVLVVDDQELLRYGYRTILGSSHDIEVVGEASNGKEAIDRAIQLHPDVVLMDIRMPEVDGIAATRQIVLDSPSTRVLTITTFDLDEYVFGSLRAGASGFLLKDVRPADLIEAIHTVASGDAVVSARATRRLLDEFAHLSRGSASPVPSAEDITSTLTVREREVLVAVAEGLANAEIAAQLFVSEATVKSHVGSILSKLGLRDRVQVVILAYESGLVQPGGNRV
jgi:DNA-binding NarL/FixJ family response regulator